MFYHLFVQILLHTHDKFRALLHDVFAYGILCLQYVKSLLTTDDINVHYFEYEHENVFKFNFSLNLCSTPLTFVWLLCSVNFNMLF